MLEESEFVKIQVATPVGNADEMRRILGEAGAGEQVEYTFCSGSWRSVGRFIPGDKAKPAIGETGRPQEVEEEIIQTICHKDKLPDVIKAIKQAHPYEEPPIDIIPRYKF